VSKFSFDPEVDWTLDIMEPDWQRKIESPENRSEHFRALRALYAAAEKADAIPVEYIVDWAKVFTPIEYQVWCDIRCAGLPMCPQYPIGKYFVDFADPVKRIAIECDGKQWHDEGKDSSRDYDLWENGWLVFRFPGSDCMRCSRPDDEEIRDMLESEKAESLERRFVDWMEKTSEGGIEAMSAIFYGGETYHVSRSKMTESLEARLLVGTIKTPRPM